MALDASIFGALGVRPKSVADYTAEDNTNQLNALNLQAGRQKLAAYEQDQAERQSLRNLLSGQTIDLSTPEGQAKLYSAAPTIAPGILKTHQEGLTSAALAGKDTAQAREYNATADQKKYDLHRSIIDHGMQAVSQSSTPDQARAQIAEGVQRGFWSEEDAQKKLASVPNDPQQFQQWRLGQMAQLMNAHDQFEANRPTLGTRDVGSAIQSVATNPMTGVPVVTATSVKSATPGEVLQANTSRANNQATIAGENLRAGVGSDGGFDANAEATAQAIAKGQLQPPSGMALLNPKNQRILGRVMEINPDFDSTTVTAKRAAATAFTSGALGNQMRSFATSGQHLDQLGTLIDNLNNGDNQTLNKIGNSIKTWNGASPVTSFDAAKDVVAKEVMKAIVAGGGGQAEREELAKSLSSANSPQQLKGVVQQYRNLMSAQYENLLEQRRAAGLPDSTMPKYAEPSAGSPAAIPAAPSGFKITHVDGKPQ